MQKKLRVKKAFSLYNGICFYSKRDKKHVTVSTIDDDGIISTRLVTKKECINLQYEKKDNHDFLLIVPSIVITAIPLYYFKDNKLMTLRIFLLGIIIFSILAFIENIYQEKKTDSLKFHASEHMVINAFNHLQRVPTLQEVKTYSRYHKACGTNSITEMILYFLIVFLMTYIPSIEYKFVFFCVSLLLLEILSLVGGLNFIQFFTTSPPTDRELSVAIKGIEYWLKYETETPKT